jgi:beta-glucosidase
MKHSSARTVTMSDGFMWNDGLDGVAWGVATADSLAAPPPGPEGSAARLPATGHHHQWADDLRETAGAALTTHRAIAGWPHLQPDGPGAWDKAALDRCDRALDALLERGLRPGLTLLHLSLPPWLNAAGGWLARDTAHVFADYADGMARRFGDRVDRWVISTDLAGPTLADHVAGMYPTSQGRGMAGLPSVHHLLLGHGLAVQALRAAGAAGGIGTTVTLVSAYPATGDPWDRLAAERFENWAMRVFLDPMLLGRHMATGDGGCPVEATGCVRPGDMETIAAAQDVLYLSWHQPHRVTAPENLPGLLPTMGCFGALNEVNRLLVRLGFALVPFDEVETTAYGWPVIPEALADGVASLHDLYGDLLPPLTVVDNGMDDPDLAGERGEAGGTRRRALLRARLSWLARVVAGEMELRGYEYWPVLDNLEAKLRYARLYGMAVPDPGSAHEPPPQPPIPSDWVHGDAFGGCPGGGTPRRPGLAVVRGAGRTARS